MRPTILRLRAYFGHDEGFALLLHIRPRGRLSTGVEVAVQCAMAATDEGKEFITTDTARVFALEPPPGAPPTAGVEGFVDSLLRAGGACRLPAARHPMPLALSRHVQLASHSCQGPAGLSLFSLLPRHALPMPPRPLQAGFSHNWEDYNEPYSLQLPTEPDYGGSGWTGADLALLDAADVKVEAEARRGHHGERLLRVSFPTAFAEPAICTSFLWTASKRYSELQAGLKKRRQERAAAAGAAGGAGAGAAANLADPDAPEAFLQRWEELRERDMSWLHTTLASTLKLACSYRGPAAVALSPGPGAAAGAAAGAVA